MASKVQFKRSNVEGKVPLTTDLDLGELAINTFDGKVYLKKNDGSDTIVDVTAATSIDVVVRNETGSTVPAGTVIYLNGSSGNKPLLALAQATSESTSTGTYAVTKQAIANNQNGVAVIIGQVTKLNTSAYTAGQVLWLSPTTPGGFTTTKPVAPNHAVYVAIVTRVSATQGTIEVKIQNGYELDELHNVLITTVADGEVLTYEASTGLWKNKPSVSSNANVFSTSRQIFTATAGQTTFSTTYTVGQIDVYFNGTKLVVGSDVTASNGTSIVLAQAAAAGDTIEVVKYGISSILVNLSQQDLTITGGNLTLNGQADIRFADADSSNWVGFQAPTTVANNTTWTLPAADGTSGQVLSTDGSGTLAWSTVSGGGTSRQVGEIMLSTSTPTGGTWLETGKYYSKAAYPQLAAVVGDVPDLGSGAQPPQAKIPVAFTLSGATNLPYMTATDGTTTVAVGQSGAIRVTTDGINWTPVPSYTTGNFTTVSYLNGNFIALTSSNIIVTSTNGIDWVLRNPSISGASPIALNSVAFGNSRYVAVGGNGTILYSTDLATWTQITFPVIDALALNTLANAFIRVAFGNNTFVAVGANGICWTSTDGINWANRQFIATGFQDLVYANNIFVATTTNSQPWYSTDGIFWNSQYALFGINSTAGYSYVTATDGVATIAVGQSGAIRRTTDGITWSAVGYVTGQLLNSVSYLNGNFVIAGNTGVLITSANGSDWLLRNTNVTNTLISSAFGAGMYVVAGAGGTVLYSTDLNSWSRASGVGVTVNKVIFANNIFVAVGQSAGVFTSTNGITWTQRSAGTTNAFYDVIFANGLFVAVGDNGACFTSPDGTTWTSRSTGGVSTLVNIVFGNNLFLAVVNPGLSSGATVITSPDGITWTLRTLSIGSSISINAACWNGSNFIVVGSTGRWASSPDGITWTLNADVSVCPFNSVAVVSGKTIAFGSNGAVVLAGAARSEVLKSGSWNYFVNAINTFNPRTIVYNGVDRYVAVGGGGIIMSSTDGLTWTSHHTGINGSFDKVFFLNNSYIVLGGNTANTNLLTSTNGTTWTSRNVDSQVFNAAAFGAGLYVVAGAAGVLYTSPDLVNWTQRSAGSSTFNDIIFANNIFVAVSTSNSHYTSTDGITWTLRGSLAGAMNRVIYANGLFVAVGNSNNIFTSPDGILWTGPRTTNVGSNIYDVIWNGSIFCAVGSSGYIATSPDGVTWTVRVSNSTDTLLSVAWSGTTFVATNNGNNTILVSNDGILWVPYSTQYSGGSLYTTYAGGKFITIGTNKLAVSTNGINWTTADHVQFSALPGSGTANSVTYANNRFFLPCTGTINNLFTSTDGINWNNIFVGAYPYSSSQAWYYCIWNGSAYYLVGANGRYATSSNATSWTVAQDVSASSFTSVAVVSDKTVAFGLNSCVVLAGGARTEVLQNGTWAFTLAATSTPVPRTIAYNGLNQYVAATGNGVFLSSTDGLTWTGRYSGVTGNYDKVFFLNANYIAMGGTGRFQNLVTSPDGINWTSRIAGTQILNAAAFGAGLYVVVGAAGVVFTSPDLVNWTPRIAGSNTFRDIIFANNLFVAIGENGTCYTSTDGVTWSARTFGTSSPSGNRVIFANGLFVATTQSATILTSPDGITWTQRIGTTGTLNDITWNGSLFCAVGGGSQIVTSSDGTYWISRSNSTIGDSNATLINISWTGTRFIATSNTQGVVWASTDGTTWTRVSTARSSAIIYSAYLGGRMLAISSSGLQTSTDGLNWTNSTHVQYVPSAVTRMYKFGGYYYACTNGGLFESTDGITFTVADRTIPPSGIIAVAYSGSAWLAVISATSLQPQVFYKSTDGLTWTKSADFGTLTNTTSLPGAVTDLVYANGNFISSQTITPQQNINAGIYTSPDGVTWTGRILPFGVSATGTLASDGTTVIASTANYTIRSNNGGITWSIIFPSIQNNNAYVNGVWILGSFASSDLSKFTSANLTPGFGIYVYNSKFIYTAANPTTRVISTVNDPGSITYLTTGNSSNFVFTTFSNNTKELIARDTTLILPVANFSNSTAPYLIAEINIRSYNTNTTFWVPPQVAGGGQSAYIYAGA